MRHVQLRAFHHVATCGGFSRAAEDLGLTQPAISDQVRRLEADYDLLLFDRSRRQVRLTAAGERLLAITRRLFDAEQQALDLLSETRALRTGTLRIVADAAHHLTGILDRFRRRFPGVHVTVSAGNTETVVARLSRYEADVGMIGEIPAAGEFEHLRVSSAPIIAFAAAQHPLAAAGRASFADLTRHPLVFRERGSRTRTMLEDAAAAGVALLPAIEAEGREAVREIVAAGLGIGFVSAAEFGGDPRLAPITIAGAEGFAMDEALICLRERREGKLIRAFFEVARAAAG